MFGNIFTIIRIALTTSALLYSGSLAPAGAQTTEPKLEYLMTYKALLEPAYKIDDTLYIINVLPGGWAKGPTIHGAFIRPGGDWLRLMPSGGFRLDARITLRTEEGDLLYFTYNGVIEHTEASLAKVMDGHKYTHEDVPCFITAPLIQTASKKCGYLNRVQLISKFVEGRLSKDDGYVIYDVFIVR